MNLHLPNWSLYEFTYIFCMYVCISFVCMYVYLLYVCMYVLICIWICMYLYINSFAHIDVYVYDLHTFWKLNHPYPYPYTSLSRSHIAAHWPHCNPIHQQSNKRCVHVHIKSYVICIRLKGVQEKYVYGYICIYIHPYIYVYLYACIYICICILI
jgi:hypothetical protein